MLSGEVKVSTVEVESLDNMATLPVSRAHHGGDTEKANAVNKEMELKKVQPKPDKRYEARVLCLGLTEGSRPSLLSCVVVSVAS